MCISGQHEQMEHDSTGADVSSTLQEHDDEDDEDDEARARVRKKHDDKIILVAAGIYGRPAVEDEL